MSTANVSSDSSVTILDHHRGRPFQLSAVERELRDLWKEASQSSQGRGAITRACTLNLIVWDEAGGHDPDPVILEVSREAPGRIFLLVIDPTAQEGSIWSEVSAVCHLRHGGGHICGEQIRITAHPSAASLLPSVVQSLVIGDLPIVLWNVEGDPHRSDAFGRLVRLADQVILDSVSLSSSRELRTVLAQLVRNPAHRQSTVDLAWGRLSAWREQIANTFEAPSRRSELSRIRRVQVDQADGETIGAEAVYLGAWLTSRLGWSGPQASLEADSPEWCYSLPDHPGLLTLRKVASTAPAGTVVRVTLETVDQGARRYVITLEGEHIRVSITPPDGAILPGALSGTPAPTPALMADAFQNRRHDSHFAAALNAAISLLDVQGTDR